MAEQEMVDRQESENLLCELQKRISDFVIISIIGIPFGFAFNGELVDVDDEIATLTNVTVLPPGGTTFALETVTVNLEVISAVGDPGLPV